MTLNQKLIFVVILSASAMAFAAAGPISGLTALSDEPADDDLFLAYDMAIPMTAAIEYQHFEGGVEYEKIDGYVVNAHLDWTVDQGAKNIDVGNIPATFDASIITSGYLSAARGGTGVNASEYSGLYGYNGGGIEVDSKSELEAQIADVSDFAEADGDTYSGTHDFTGATFSHNPLTLTNVEEILIQCNSGPISYDCFFEFGTSSPALQVRDYYLVGLMSTGGAGTPNTISLSDGTAGQEIIFYHETDGGSVRITPTNFNSTATYIQLDAADAAATLEFDGSKWFIVHLEGATTG